MGFVRSGMVLLACLVCLPSLNAEDQRDVRRDATVQAVERVLPSVVNIATETVISIRDPFEDLLQQFFNPYRRQRPNSQVSLGSGVIIDQAGYILTNDHVVRRADKIWVKVNTNDSPYEARLVASNPRSDIALIKIDPRNGEKFAAVSFAEEDDLYLGETVIAMGNPFGLGGSVSKGILSSKSRVAPKESAQLDIPNWLQTDASINPGNSGGPLVNLRGELIGLNVAILSDAQGIGFAIPIKQVNSALSGIFTPETSPKDLWFGARVKVGSHPLTVTTVQPESPADKAGLKTGDHILMVDGQEPRSFIEFTDALVNKQGTDAQLTIERAGERKTVRLKLVPENTFFNADLIERMLGVRLQRMTPQLAEAFGLNSTDGFLIAGVDESIPAARSLQPGFLVTAVNGQLPASLTEVAKSVYGKAKGENVRLNVLVQRRRGNFIYYQQAAVDVAVK